MASRNGLNPKIRAFKGVGFGRALPAAFSFGNGICPDGSGNNMLLITPLIGKTWPLEGTIEVWQNVIAQRAQRELEIIFSDATKLRLAAYFNVISALEVTGRSQGSASVPNGVYNNGTKYHVAYMWDATNTYAWGNSILPNTIFAGTGITSNVNLSITGAAICGQVDGNACSNTKMDELRFYRKKLDVTELALNDFNGAGGNPSITEYLFAWYTFEQFETLDFSLLQDNSDLRLGIRDMSGNLNHAQVIGMDTNPASGTYVLKPF